MKTVLITGASSGYGLETARHFHAMGWNVVATMRKPRIDLLLASDRMRVLALDVTSLASIEACLNEAGPIDVLVNNAGIGGIGALEASSMERTRDLFDTNTFGVIAMVRAIVPQMRTRRSGAIVNVTSSVTIAPMPLASVYTASKAAIAGFSGSLALELAAFDVRVKLVEPGYGPTTRFGENSRIDFDEAIPAPYRAFADPILAAFGKPALTTKESDVAEAVYRAASDQSGQLHFPAGADAVELAAASAAQSR